VCWRRLVRVFAKGLKWAVEYAGPVEEAGGLLFPAAAPIENGRPMRRPSVDSDGGVLRVSRRMRPSGVARGKEPQNAGGGPVMLLTLA